MIASAKRKTREWIWSSNKSNQKNLTATQTSGPPRIGPRLNANDHNQIVDEIAYRTILDFYKEEEEVDDKEEDGDNDNDAHH
jgi:hypothetical protein